MKKAPGLSAWDYSVIGFYFVLVIAVGICSMIRTNRTTLNGYFLAGRQMNWLVVGFSLFASNIGSEHFVGLAGSGAATGLAVGAFEMCAGVIIQVLGWVYLPVYIASRATTLPEYMTKRFGGQRIRLLLSIFSLVLYVFIKVSVNLYAGSLFIKEILNWNIYLSIILLLCLTAVSTITGGLAAVIYMDSMQAAIIVGAGIVLVAMGLYEVGGLTELMVLYTKAIPKDTIPNTTCGYPPPDSWEMLRKPSSPVVPWPGFWFGQSATSLWYWCSDQMMVQRVLASKSLSHAQGGTLLVAYLKFLPVFLMVIPGMISRVLYTDVIACAVPEKCYEYCGSRVSCSNLAYPYLVIHLMPTGLRGLLIAAMLAALMSDLTSVFNSSSTLVTMDIWPRIRKGARTKELLIVGKLSVVVMCCISIAWVPIILSMQGGQLFDYINSIASFLAPPIAAVYLMAVLWKRMNEHAAFWGLLNGFGVGIIRLLLEFVYQSPECGQEGVVPSIVADVHYMYFAIIVFWITVMVVVTVSYCTKPPEQYLLIRTLYWTRFSSDMRPDDKVVMLGCDESDLDIASKKSVGGLTITSSRIVEVKLPVWKRFFFWVCGYSPEPKRARREEKMDFHVERISFLNQSKGTKVFLRINLILIILITIVLNLLFTLGTRALLNSLLNKS